MRKHCSKRKDGRWQYSKQKDGWLYYAIASTYAKLLAKIPFIKPRRIKKLKNYKSGKMSVVQYFEFYKEHFVNNKKITEKSKEEWTSLIETKLEPFFKNLPLENLTTELVQDFVDGIKGERMQERVYQKVVRVLQKAYITNKIKNELTQGLDKPIKTIHNKRSPMTLTEQIAFVKEARHSDVYAMAIFALVTGARREGILAFNLNEDIDETRMKLHIKETKTENSDRWIDVTPQFVTFLKQNMKCPMFKMHPTTATDKIKTIYKNCGINKTLHELRHTCSANLYFLGAKDKYRQMYLGHASIVITNDIYTNIKEDIPKSSLLELYGDLYPSFD